MTAKNVLFLCASNSARSILAEAILNERGAGRFKAFSAGSEPSGVVHPAALAELDARGIPGDGLESKSWDRFGARGAPRFDLVFTVDDVVARGSGPPCRGRPVAVNWCLPDPASVRGTDQEVGRAFGRAFERLSSMIDGLLLLPLDTMGRTETRKALLQLALEPDA